MYLVLSLLMSTYGFGETVVVKAPEAPLLEYRAYLKASADRISPSQKYLNQHPTQENRNRLLLLLAEAQRKFLSGSTAQAREAFQIVLQLKAEDDWSLAERQALLYSALRLAQLTPQEQDKYLETSLTLGEDLQPDAKLFPPPLIERRRTLAMAPKVSIDVSRIREKFSWMILNGFHYEISGQNKISIPPGDYRVTYVSDSFPAQTHTGSARDIESFLADSLPLAQGTCTDHPPGEFFGVDCGVTPKEVRLKPTFTQPTPMDFKFSANPLPIYKNGWFWAGVGVVVAAVIMSQKKEKESSPSNTTYGF